MNWILAGDLGKRKDSSTIGLARRIEFLKDKESLPGTWQYEDEQRTVYSKIQVPRLEEFPLQTPYRAVIERHRQIVEDPRLAGNVDHLVDATGVGDPVVEMMRVSMPGVIAIYLTNGQSVSRPDERRNDYHVPKRDIAMALLAWYESGRLEINPGHHDSPEGIRQAEVYAKYDYQIAKFVEKISANHNAVYENEMDTDHDDLVIPVALTCWWCSIKFGFEAPAPHAGVNTKPYNALEIPQY